MVEWIVVSLHLVGRDAYFGSDGAATLAGIVGGFGDAEREAIDGKAGLAVFLKYLRYETERVVARSEEHTSELQSPR